MVLVTPNRYKRLTASPSLQTRRIPGKVSRQAYTHTCRENLPPIYGYVYVPDLLEVRLIPDCFKLLRYIVFVIFSINKI